MNETFSEVSKLHYIYERLLNALIHHHEPQISASQARLLLILWEQEPVQVGELAQRACLKKTTLSAMLPRMIEQNLIAIETDPDDGRAKLVRLTDFVRQWQPQHEQICHQLQQRSLEGLSAKEQATLSKLLDKVQNNLLQMESALNNSDNPHLPDSSDLPDIPDLPDDSDE